MVRGLFLGITQNNMLNSVLQKDNQIYLRDFFTLPRTDCSYIAGYVSPSKVDTFCFSDISSGINIFASSGRLIHH